MPIFERAVEDVKWHHPDHNYFSTIYSTRIVKPYFKEIVDVQLDKSNFYLLVQEGQEQFIYAMTFADLKPEDTSDTIFKRKYHIPAPSCKLIVLSP